MKLFLINFLSIYILLTNCNSSKIAKEVYKETNIDNNNQNIKSFNNQKNNEIIFSENMRAFGRGGMEMEEHIPSVESRIAVAKASTLIISGKVTEIRPGMATMSLPPISTFFISIEDPKIIRGHPIKPEALNAIRIRVVGSNPLIKVGQYGIFYGASSNENKADFFDGAISFDNITDLEKLVTESLSGALGWENTTTSPFIAPVAKKVNYLVPEDSAIGVCSKTGRRVFATPKGLEFSVEQVITEEMKKENNYVNPYGDGEFEVHIKNTTDKDIILPNLLKDDATGKVLFESALIIGQKEDNSIFFDDEKRPSMFVFNNAPVESATAVIIKPGETISGVINTLKLKIEWMNGGSRYYFNFYLGELSATNFFYYMTNHHGKIIKENNY